MERAIKRKPFQGITNIIRFNWHYYVIAFSAIITLFILKNFLPAAINLAATILLLLVFASIFISLFVSWIIYDHSDLYKFNWLDKMNIVAGGRKVNINAGFDESSEILKEKFPESNLIVFDFYDAKKHTEVSIERARKAYPAFQGTKTISTENIPLEQKSIDTIFLILAAHEIRNNDERIFFFKQLRNSLKDDGKIIVVEHQRDIFNFIAYNFGFFHFFSPKTWNKTFASAGLTETSIFQITSCIKVFVLSKNGIAS